MINNQNTDYNECFKWCLIRYLNPADHHPARITKSDKNFTKTLDFKDIKFPVKTRNIHKIEKKTSIGISIFGYENKVKYPIYVSKKCCEDKHADLLLIGEGRKKDYVHIKDFSICVYDRRYYLQAFRTAEKLKCDIKYCFKTNGNQTIKMPKKGKYIRFKNSGEK